MTNLSPLIPIVVVALLGGTAHAGEFSLGSTRMLAQAGTDSSVDVTVNFTDRGRTQRETAEGGDSTPAHPARNQRGADEVTAPGTTETPAPKAAAPTPATTDSPHGVSISPSTAIRRPSYRWQSLVPGTIK